MNRCDGTAIESCSGCDSKTTVGADARQAGTFWTPITDLTGRKFSFHIVYYPFLCDFFSSYHNDRVFMSPQSDSKTSEKVSYEGQVNMSRQKWPT